MKHIYVIALALTLFLTTLGCGGGDNPFSGPTGAVRGSVVDEGTGKGIEGVSVVCGTDSALTNTKGEFEIEKSDVGSETITAAKTGYIGTGSETSQVTVIANDVVDAGVLKLTKLTDGTVYLTDLTPIAFNDIRTGSATFLGQTYPYTIFGDAELTDNDAVAVYSLNENFTEFKTTAGINDNTPYKSERYKFLCYVDGALLSQVECIQGQIMVISLNVSGANELRLEIRCSDSANGRAGGNYAGFGNARLVPE